MDTGPEKPPGSKAWRRGTGCRPWPRGTGGKGGEAPEAGAGVGGLEPHTKESGLYPQVKGTASFSLQGPHYEFTKFGGVYLGRVMDYFAK